jgi:hypothetical protein
MYTLRDCVFIAGFLTFFKMALHPLALLMCGMAAGRSVGTYLRCPRCTKDEEVHNQAVNAYVTVSVLLLLMNVPVILGEAMIKVAMVRIYPTLCVPVEC